MKRSFRLAYVGTLILVAVACSRTSESSVETAMLRAAPGSTTVAVGPTEPRRHGFASLPDRGELIDYPRQPVRHDGAYTWHRTDLSEAHALDAIAGGQLRLTTPSGETLVVSYDRHIEHGSGDWTWVGHLPGDEGAQTILTFGPHAAFGSIAQPGKPPLRLTVRNGVSWLVETDPAKLAGIINAATHPTKPDFSIPPKSGLPGATPSDTSAPSMASAPIMTSATTTATTTVDLVLGYTPAFASDNGGTSGAITRLNYLVDVTNIAYGNSNISARVRLVATVPVSYPDNTSNDTTLDQLTGYDSSSNTTAPANSAFSALRSAREKYGADLVSLVRSFRDPENGGCGVGWLIGGGQQGISASDAYYGYSVVSDGTDAGTDGHTYYCLDETLAHELGHNMGANHDVDNAKGTDGVLNSGDYGAYPYSFGYKNATAAFYTIMAYGDTGQHIYRIFSDPRSTFCGGNVCGNATAADNARTLTQTIPIVAGFRATVALAGPVERDFNGDGMADVLWRNLATGADIIWNSANSAMRQSIATVASQDWKIVGTGDFDGDHTSDVLWRNVGTGSNVIWKSAASTNSQSVMGVTNQDWKVAAVGDFDGDSKADILWRNAATGADVIWKSGNYATQQAVTGVSDLNWKIVGADDFNGDGSSDILWRNPVTGANAIWLSGNSSLRQSISAVAASAWAIVGTGDFNGDGVADILWRNSATGANTIWRSGNSAASQGVATVASTSWKVAEVGDFNGDGKSDLLWRNVSTGDNAIWLSANASTRQPMTAVASLEWAITP
jgi:hypothetical protein